MLKQLDINIKNYVHNEEKDIPLVGIYNEDYDINVATADKSAIVSMKDIRTRYNTYVGGNEFNITEGAKFLDFNSIVFKGIDFDSIKRMRRYNSFSWTPVYTKGFYSMFYEEMQLYSSYHYSSVMEKVDDHFEINLRSDCNISSIEIAFWEREKTFIKTIYKKFSLDSDFTNSSRKYKYRFENNNTKVITNDCIKKEVGNSEKTEESIKEFWEYNYKGNSSGRLVFTGYFPLEDKSLEVVAISNSGNIITLKEVENIDMEDDSEYIYQVDNDLGIITIGGNERSSLFLLEDINSTQRVIKILNREEMKSYPSTGILKVGNELIYYSDKSYDSFLNCSRGVNGTVASVHPLGGKVQHIKTGKSIGSNYAIYCKYNVAPKIRYEVCNKVERYANYDNWLNLKPIDNIKPNGVIQISTVDRHVAELDLTIEADYIFADMYGPIYYGTDFKKLVAKAMDSYGNPVDGIDITIDIIQGPGFLNYSLMSFTDISNTLGEIYTVYGVPYNWESIKKDVLNIRHENNRTIMDIEEIPGGLTSESIQVFQVLKHDPVLGTSGKKMKGVSQGANLTYGNGELAAFAFIEVEETMDSSVDRYEGGYCYLIFDNGARVGPRKINQIVTTLDLSTTSWSFGADKGMVLLLDKGCSEITNNSAQISHVMVFEKEAVEFSTVNLRGCRKVLYEWRNDIKHPITGDLGAYFPIGPDSVSKNELGFNSLLPLPEPYNDDSNLGGYVILCSDSVIFQAKCTDPMTGNIIKSNKIKLRIDIPAYLNGISRQEGLSIPYGFKFVTEDFNHSSGIGGSTFLSINPLNEDIIDLGLEFK
jgi:hypothetical protein